MLHAYSSVSCTDQTCTWSAPKSSTPNVCTVAGMYLTPLAYSSVSCTDHTCTWSALKSSIPNVCTVAGMYPDSTSVGNQVAALSKKGRLQRPFSTVNAAVTGTVIESQELLCDGLVTGSDEEQALVSAAKNAYSQSNCTGYSLHKNYELV